MKTYSLIVLGLVLSISTSHAADRSLEERQVPIDVPAVSGDVEVDAYLDEAVWQDALRLTIDWETWPAENIPARAETEAFIAFNGETLFIAFIAHDPAPELIRAHYSDRDAMFQDDFVGVVMDTFNDERRGFEFFVNPLGVQGDLFKDDIQGGEDASYDTIWESAGRLTETGYVVEMALPMRSLRFAASEEPQIWGIDFIRIYPREERHQFRMYRADRNLSCTLCEYQKFRGFAGADPGNNLQLVPTVTGIQTNARPDYGLPMENGDFEVEPSLDLEWGITPNVILNGTLNPDFSQVEADVAQLDVNNQFSLFFPERRPFFLEGRDLFQDPFNIVYTRNIADPEYGAKVTGKEGSHAFGAFFANDEQTSVLFPGSQGNDFGSFDFKTENAAMRYRYDIGGNSTVGIIATDRSGDDYSNSVIGVDTKYRFTDSDSITAEVLTSETEYDAEMVAANGVRADPFEGSASYVGYNRNRREYNIYAEHQQVDEDFRADLGFLPQVGFDKSILGGGYNWFGNGDDWYRRIRLNGDVDRTEEAVSGIELEQETEAYISVNTVGWQGYAQFGGIDRTQYWDGVEYDQDILAFYGEIKPNKMLSTGMSLRHGDAIDYANSRAGRTLTVDPWFIFRLGRHLNLRFDPTYQRMNVDGGRLFSAWIHELRATWQFNNRMFLRVITQYRDLYRNQDLYLSAVNRDQTSWSNQVLFSYKLNPRTVFFAGYSDGKFAFNDGLVDNPLQTQEQTLFFKLSYAWQL